MKTTFRWIAAAALVTTAGLALHPALAQQPAGITRSAAWQHDLDANGREVIQVRVDFAAGAAFGRHVHPGEEIAYVLEGTVEYQFDGKPPIVLKAGDSLFIPAGAVHSARNVGSTKAAELATYLVEKDKPLVSLK